jgi:hypothetical protein
MPSHRASGRIRPDQRDTDDSNGILGDDVAIQEEHIASVRATEQQNKERNTKIDMRNRLDHIIKFLRDKYPEYYAVGVKEITEEDRSHSDRFYHKSTHDLIYTGLNVKVVKAFLGTRKKKENGKTCSFVQLRKYNDCILHGAKEADERLPRTYYEEMEKFLTSFKKETAKAKKDGNLDEQEADPISWSLFRLMLGWLLESKNVFVWVYSILQWNCMARSINIGVLGLHNFRLGEDSVICKYDKTKADQAGEKVADKNIYANPFDPLTCPHLALAIWLWYDSSNLEFSEAFFKRNETEDNAASNRYCSQISELMRQKCEIVREYIRVEHANSHGTRKGSATMAISGTTVPPSVSSIAARGE